MDIRQKTTRIITWIILLILLILIVYQVSFIWNDYARVQLGIVKRYTQLESRYRSSRLIFKNLPANYLRFLNLYLPEDMAVVLPPINETGELQRQHWFSDQNMMQFYLFPRTILLCDQPNDAECNKYLAESNTAVLAFGNFPPVELMQDKTFTAFEDAVENIKGVYVPTQTYDQLPVPSAKDYSKPERVPWFIPLIDILIWSAIFLIGFVYATLIINKPNWLEVFMLSIP